jgi:hypothetical protein
MLIDRLLVATTTTVMITVAVAMTSAAMSDIVMSRSRRIAVQ